MVFELHMKMNFASRYCRTSPVHHLNVCLKGEKRHQSHISIISTISHFNFASHFMLSLLPIFLFLKFNWQRRNQKLFAMKRNFSFFHSENAFRDNFFFTDWPMDKLMIWSKIHTTKTEKCGEREKIKDIWISTRKWLNRKLSYSLPRIKSDHCTQSANICRYFTRNSDRPLNLTREKKNCCWILSNVSNNNQSLLLCLSTLQSSQTAISNGKWDSTDFSTIHAHKFI